MKSKRTAMIAGIILVGLLMPVMPSYITNNLTESVAVTDMSRASEEKTASYSGNDVDLVSVTQEELKEAGIFFDKAIAIDKDYLAVYDAPSEEAEVVGKLFEYNICDVIKRDNEWTRIVSGELEGFVKTQALCFDDEAFGIAKLEADLKVIPIESEAIVYASNLSDASVIDTLQEGSYMMPISTLGQYTKVLLEDGEYGYILSNTIEINYGFDKGLTLAQEEAKKAEEEARRLKAEEEAKRLKEEEEARKAAQEQKRQLMIERTKDGTDFTYNPTMTISDEDLWVLACIIDWESGWETYEGKLAVANIVLNRVRSSGYPNDVQSVVYAKSQFGGVMSGGSVSDRFAERLNAGPRTDECMQAAMEAVSGKNNIGGYTAFNGSGSVDYSRVSDFVIIGSHCFY